jgi:hypothetical protein
MLTGPKYSLHAITRNTIAPDVSQLMSDLNVAGGEIYRIDNLKKINRLEPPVLVRSGDGRLIKIRSFSSEAEADAFLDFLGKGFWPHVASFLGRRGLAVAEEWVEGESVSDNRYHRDWISIAGGALGRLHASLTGNGSGDVGWLNAASWVKSTSNRVCELSRRDIINQHDRKRLLQLIDRYAPDSFECGLTHGDFAPDNLLVDAQGRLVCIDNETVRRDALDYDLTRTILRWPLSGARRRAFLTAYSAFRDLRPTTDQSPFWLIAVLARASEWECRHLGAPSERVLRCLCRAASTDGLGNVLRAKPSVSVQNRLYVRFLNSRIEIISQDAGLLAWLKEFLAPQFAISVHQSHDERDAWSVEILASEADYCELEALRPQECPSVPMFLRDEGWDYARDCGQSGEERLFFHGEHEAFYGVDAQNRRVRIYSRRRNFTLRLAAMKIVRELGMRQLWREGKLMLHAAAFASGGNGCLILGPKGAGKTTLLTYCLQSEAASYVTNDRAALVENETGFAIRGIPTIVSLRSGTTGYFPILREGQKHHRYRLLQSLDEAQESYESSPISQKVVESPNLSPAQYTAHLRCAVAPEARLMAVIVPNIRTSLDGLEPSGFHIRRLDPGSAEVEIDSALFGPAKGWPGGGMIPPELTVPSYLSLHRELMVKKILRAIPCFQVDVHEVAFKTASFAAALNLMTQSSTDPANKYAVS